ncbi:DUF4062 domain-containing protein [Catellatospora sp. NEAU-YM18]|nr:DUF4062 domain-containing protein [Catellatospora tritici]
MDDERDMLVQIVIPLVNRQLRDSGFAGSLYPVDLRWGVNTDEHLDAASRQLSILRTCVAEVRRCRPLFVGLIGHRYGWIPSPSLARTALAEARLPDPGLPLSVTMMEMLAAVHSADREPPVLLKRVTSHADLGAACMSRGDMPPADRGALDAMEGYFTALGHPFVPFAAQWSPREARFESPEFIKLATGALLAAAERQLSHTTTGTWLDAELAAQRLAAEDEVQSIVGRVEELDYIADHWNLFSLRDDHSVGDQPRHPLWMLRRLSERGTIAVVGAPGSGKSALLAKVAIDLKVRDMARDDLVRRAYVRAGLTAATRRLPVCLLLLLAQLDRQAATRIAAGTSAEALALGDVLDVWLSTLRAATQLDAPLVVFDGLDQLVGAQTAITPVAWLPTTLGDRVHLIVSAAAETFEAELLRERPNTHVLELAELPVADARVLVGNRIAARHRAIAPEPLAALVARPRSPRWLVVATDLLLALTGYDYLALRDTPPTADPEAALRRLLSDVAAELPPDLDALDDEVFSRLVHLLGSEFTVPFCFLAVMPAGLDEQTLRAVLALSAPSLSEGDLAMLRDVFSTHIHVTDGEWRFRHISTLLAVHRFLTETSGEVGLDLTRAYREIAIRHLATQPPEHGMRVRYLLPLLFHNGDYRALVTCVQHPDTTPDEAIQALAVELGWAATLQDAPATVLALCDATRSDDELLTVLGLVSVILPVLSHEHAATVVARLRELLPRVVGRSPSRFGLGHAELASMFTYATADLRDLSAHSVVRWLDTALRGDGVVSLRQAPVLPLEGSAYHRTVAAVTTLAMLSEYALAAAGGIIDSAPSDAAELHARLSAVRQVVSELAGEAVIAAGRELLHLHVATAERAAALAWPDGGFRPVANDFARCQALVDNARGSAEFVVLFALNARANALAQLNNIGDMSRMTPEDAPFAAAALAFLEEAAWQLSVQLRVAPAMYSVEAAAIPVHSMRQMILAMCDQDGSAYEVGLALTAHPHVIDVAGWPGFVMFAAQTLGSYLQSRRPVDPSPLIVRLSDELDERGYDLTGLDTDLHEFLPLLPLTASMLALCQGFPSTAVATAQRTLARIDAGVIVDDPDDAAIDLVRAAVTETEVEIVEWLQDVADEGEDAEPLTTGEEARLEQLCATLDGLRHVSIAHDGGQYGDYVGLGLSTAIRHGQLRLPCSDAALQHASRIAAASATDEHAATVLKLIRHLLR